MKHFALVIVLMLNLLSSVSFAYECVMKSRIRQFRVVDGRLYLDINRRTSYELDVRICPYLDWARRIRFNTWPQNSMRVCPGDDVVLHDLSGRYIDTCRIWDIHKVEH